MLAVFTHKAVDRFLLGVYTPIMKVVTPKPAAKAREIAFTCACGKLRKASRAVTQYYEAALQPSNLTITQFGLLVALNLAEPVPIGVLADELVMDRTTLKRNIELLVRDGMVEIVQGNDRRAKLLKSTGKGRTSFERAIPLWDKAQNSLVARFGKQNLKELGNSLAALTSLALFN
jgi:DNA-binding MarR family transcriptional regulator